MKLFRAIVVVVVLSILLLSPCYVYSSYILNSYEQYFAQQLFNNTNKSISIATSTATATSTVHIISQTSQIHEEVKLEHVSSGGVPTTSTPTTSSSSSLPSSSSTVPSTSSLPVSNPSRGKGRPSLPASAKGKPLVTLVMIIKNEAKSILTTLNSVLGWVDRYSILDTGSTDNTITLMNDWFKKHLEVDQYQLFQEPFVDFSTTRNRALKLAGPDSEFILMMNGDDRLVNGKALRVFLESRRHLTGIDEAMYIVPIHYGGITVGRSERLCRSSNHFVADWPNDDYHHWRFEGVTHEVYVSQYALQSGIEMIYTPDDKDSFYIYHDITNDGDSNKKKRFELDIELLSRELKDHPHRANRARTIFYLAQSYYNLGDYKNAIKWFQSRVATDYPRTTPSTSDNEKSRSYLLLSEMYMKSDIRKKEGEKKADELITQYLTKADQHCSTSYTKFLLARHYARIHDSSLAKKYVQQAESMLNQQRNPMCADDEQLVRQGLPRIKQALKL